MNKKKTTLEMAMTFMESKQPFVLATIIDSAGSAPRKAGAQMLLLPDGTIYGTVGGGAIEYAAMQDGQQLFLTKEVMTKQYDLTNHKAATLGMICGGFVTIEFQYVSPDQEELYEAFQQKALTQRKHVYIFGGGHVAQELVPLLTHLEFTCTVFDDRPEFACDACFPEADNIICGDFERIFDYIQIHPQDFVCIMTRGHQFDYVVQKQVLKVAPRYIGVMGSRKKTERIQKQLLEDGFQEADIFRCKSPIGLSIHAETPAEIAVSIAGELIQIQRENP